MMQKAQTRERAQVVASRPRRAAKSRPRRSAGKAVGKIFHLVTAYSRPLAFVAALIALAVAYRVVASSSLFELRRVEINAEASPALRASIEQAVRRAIGQAGMLDVDLDAVRQKVKELPRVREASVARMLPDGIYINAVERKPALLARRESKAIVWLDDEGVELGEIGNFKSGEKQEVPPIARGFAEGARSPAAIAEDRERIAAYKQIQKELTEGTNPVWNLVDEIDLSFPQDVSLRLINPPVTVHLGGKDFRGRLDMALQVVHALKRGDADLLSRFRVQDAERLIENANRISFIDAAREDRIVLSFSAPGTEKTVRQENRPEAKKPNTPPKKG
ncbi:MAG TPA: FtsQ-type POTRA domain-containing protein [Blastocatellia bacterium]|nr:FtsQ-type POTRA domain-containing protein [Blastocatellia bacterium]